MNAKETYVAPGGGADDVQLGLEELVCLLKINRFYGLRLKSEREAGKLTRITLNIFRYGANRSGLDLEHWSHFAAVNWRFGAL